MLSVEEAQARLLAGVEVLPAEWVALAAAGGRRLAAPVVAKRDQPPFASSAMDGYAVRSHDLPGPWRVVGEAAAGRRFGAALGAGEAARIFTGAPLPDGADMVVIQEDARREGDALALTAAPGAPGANVRRAALDFAAGDIVLPAGTVLTAAAVGLAAAAGQATLGVRCRPRVGLLATGDELVLPGSPPGPDQIVSSNNAMLAALIAPHAVVEDAGIARDDRAAIAAALARLADCCDLVLTLGGASVGDHDLVLPALREAGATIDFWKVAVRPGKPMLAGTLGAARVIGLPGNPVSAFVCAVLFALPLLRAMGGDTHPLPALVDARLGQPLPANGGRRDHLRATLADGVVILTGVQDSSMLRVLAASNTLIVREPGVPAADAGDTVQCIPI